jgi:hypothetical protein
MNNWRVEWRLVTPLAGSYKGSEIVSASNEDEALELAIKICREKGLNNYVGKLTIMSTEILL